MNHRPLAEIVESWIGTPFSANACVPGPQGGVSCQRLAAAIYVELGILPQDVQVPSGRINRGRFNRVSEIIPWVDSRPEFHRRDLIVVPAAGDLLGFEIGHCINHLGVAIGDDQFVHCLEGMGVGTASLLDATWLARWKACWRPTGGLHA